MLTAVEKRRNSAKRSTHVLISRAKYDAMMRELVKLGASVVTEYREQYVYTMVERYDKERRAEDTGMYFRSLADAKAYAQLTYQTGKFVRRDGGWEAKASWPLGCTVIRISDWEVQ